MIFLHFSRICILFASLSILAQTVSTSKFENDTTSRNTRFSYIPFQQRMKKDNELLVFISITSGPQHAHLRNAIRNTWLTPCMSSTKCDYRFFIDAPKEEEWGSLPEHKLNSESDFHQDMVFRDFFCPLMRRHPQHINYGNSPPSTSGLKRKINDTVTVDNPDYLYRRLYKIDWKVCFMQYVKKENLMPAYHVFVEDDSFVCTENLLYQATLLWERRLSSKYQPSIRTGTPMYDGFDDSSTFMTGDIATAFADHYGEPGFNCANIVDHVNSTAWYDAMWLSWGNSWMKLRCDWVHVLKAMANITVIRPKVSCLTATTLNSSMPKLVLDLPCISQPLIIHHGSAPEVLLHGSNVHSKHIPHICEYLLFIDKVKEPNAMFEFWNRASVLNNFHDFSDVFLTESYDGWKSTLSKLAAEEIRCRHAEENPPDRRASEDCLFESKRRLAEKRVFTEFIFGPHRSNAEKNRFAVDRGEQIYRYFLEKML